MALSRPVPTAPHPGPLAHKLEGRVQGAAAAVAWLSGAPSPAHLYIQGGGERGWHAVPSTDGPTSAWLAFLPELAKE